MIQEIIYQQCGAIHAEFQAVHSNELRPAKTKSTVSVTCLTIAWKEEYRLTIFMLDAFQLLFVKRWYIILLSRGVWIQLIANTIRELASFFRAYSFCNCFFH